MVEQDGSRRGARRVIATALARREAGDLVGAARLLSEALERDFSDPNVCLQLGNILAELGEDARAERAMRHALKLAPGDLGVRLNHGVLLGQTGRYDEAAAALAAVAVDAVRVALPGDPDDEHAQLAVHAQVMLARVRLEQGRLDEALALATPLCVHRYAWGMADDLVVDCAVEAGLDPTVRAVELARGRGASPAMLCHLIEVALEPPAMLEEAAEMGVAAWESFDLPPDQLYGPLGDALGALTRALAEAPEPAALRRLARARAAFGQAPDAG